MKRVITITLCCLATLSRASETYYDNQLYLTLKPSAAATMIDIKGNVVTVVFEKHFENLIGKMELLSLSAPFFLLKEDALRRTLHLVFKDPGSLESLKAAFIRFEIVEHATQVPRLMTGRS